jgi:hypothetical protein
LRQEPGDSRGTCPEEWTKAHMESPFLIVLVDRRAENSLDEVDLPKAFEHSPPPSTCSRIVDQGQPARPQPKAAEALRTPSRLDQARRAAIS